MLTRRGFLRLSAAAGAATLLPIRSVTGRALAEAADAEPLDPSSVGRFVDPLPMLDVLTAGSDRIRLHMREFRTMVLPSTFEPATGTYDGTYVWGYLGDGQAARSSYLGPVVVARRGAPTEIEWINELGDTATTHVRAYAASTDQTLHWADPLNDGASTCAEAVEPHSPPTGICAQNYAGPIPAIPHLHGGEVPSVLDGGPDAWFTSDGAYRGHAYYGGPAHASNSVVFRYPNLQQAAPLWFHDHVLGLTRLGVYAGLAGAYLLTDPENERDDLPAPVPLIIQDRMFDEEGQLLFPAGIPDIPNPEHPFWVPEFIGDTIVVNGKVWPFLEVEARRYRFLIVNGSNARAYELFLRDVSGDRPGPPIWQIGTEGGYLDRPVRLGLEEADRSLRRLLLMPGERADVIVDFGGLAPGTRLVLRNVAAAPYPAGDPVDPPTTGRIMQLRVVEPAGPDATFDPAAGGALRPPMVRLADPGTGQIAAGVRVHERRLLTLNEVIAEPSTYQGQAYPGGPLEVLLNNSEYTGESSRAYGDFTPITTNGVTNYYSETPHEGATEVWELVNLTADAHPIHLHLVQFQLVNRQRFDVDAYLERYAAAFPGGSDPMGGTTYPAGVIVPGFGPPLDYRAGRNPFSGGKDGGNPDVAPFLLGGRRRPAANEAGWKDTVRVPPGEVTRIAVRWAPMDLPASTPRRDASFAFDPDGGHGYVWHCHIIDHEDNEMMRPTSVRANDGERTYVAGVDY
jgi:FtsP/CotA-like multicopper oxidase with cupredoxin domain